MAFWDRWRKRPGPLPDPRIPVAAAQPGAPIVGQSPDEGPHEDLVAAAEWLLAAGRAEEALACFQRDIDEGATGVAGHIGQAQTYDALGRTQDALDSLEIALALDPHSAPALQLAGRLRSQCGEHAEAAALLRRAIECAPKQALVLTDYALALNAGGDADAAAEAYTRALELDPTDPAPRINLGLLHLQHFGRFDAAERCFREALAASPGHVAGLANLGLALQAQGRYDEAFVIYRDGLKRHPDHVELRWNRGLANLALGHFRQGWQDYALRLVREGRRRLDGLPFPLWQGQPLASGRLLVLAEQGLGDEIMFASCLAEVRARVPRVVLECNPRRAGLFMRSFPDVEVLARSRGESSVPIDSSAAFDAMIPAGSLPALFRPDAASFPAHRGYLRAEPVRVAFWRHRLDRLGPGLKVGVSWIGGVAHTRRSLRSVSLADLEPVLGMPDLHCVNLQYSECAGEIAALHDRTGHVVHHWPEAIADYDETAALVTALDVVLTVTTSLVHLTGALGRPALVLVPAFAEWRYLASGEGMPWYPSVRMLRQQRPGDWASVVRRACDEFTAMREAGRLTGGRDA